MCQGSACEPDGDLGKREKVAGCGVVESPWGAVMWSSGGRPLCPDGFIPGFTGSQRLARIVGVGIAKQIIYTSQIT